MSDVPNENRDFTLRAATTADIERMHRVRLAVTENILSTPAAATPERYAERLTAGRGLGWVAEVDGEVAGFAIVALADGNLWALFVHPEHEGCGIGTALCEQVLAASADRGVERLWLTTETGTQAESFYRKRGWQLAGPNSVIGDRRLEIAVP